MNIIRLLEVTLGKESARYLIYDDYFLLFKENVLIVFARKLFQLRNLLALFHADDLLTWLIALGLFPCCSDRSFGLDRDLIQFGFGAPSLFPV